MQSDNQMIYRTTIRDFDPLQTFLCGQCFRWEQDNTGLWSGIVLGRQLRLEWQNGECTFYGVDERQFNQDYASYFDLDTDYTAIKEALCQKDDHLNKAIAFGGGIRLLRQDLWEVLLSFVISQNNGIPRIKQIIESLSRLFGSPLSGEADGFAFPQPEALMAASLEQLKLCRSGYRCRYISAIADRLAGTPELLSQLHCLPKEKARELLLSLPGIGQKVADCVLLYSGIDRSAFPVDRWVKRVMEALYFKRETDENTIREFAKDYFGDLAGIAQQYLFYYARAHKIGL